MGEFHTPIQISAMATLDVRQIVLSAKNGLQLIEIPVKMRERKKGKSSITFYSSFYYMTKVILAMFITALRKI